jgi:Zn-dependent metalloprotease
MSFIDGIFSGIAGTVRGVLGIEQEPRTAVSSPAARSADLARDSRTSYQRPTASDGGPAGPRSSRPTLTALLEQQRTAGPEASSQAPSLLDRLHGNVQSRSTTRDPGSPLAGAYAPDRGHGSETGYAAAQGHAQAREGVGTVTNARAHIMDATTRASHGTTDTLGGTSDAAIAARNVQRGMDYFATTFGRNGVDGAGSGVDVLINDRSLDEHGNERFRGNGGYYAMPDGAGGLREAIHFGTGTTYYGSNGLVEQREMLHADDLAIHELVHGIIRKETGHLGGGADEAGATNEAIADVLSAAATRDWSIGEGMYTAQSDYKLMRNIADPTDARAIHGLWTSMDEIHSRRAAGEEIEEHWASGVISTAAHRVQQRIGGDAGWGAVERVFYDTIVSRRLGDMSFEAVATALRTSAGSLYGSRSDVARTFDEELRRAGL